VGPFVVDLSHPLGDSLSLESTVWAGQGGPASCPGLPVVCAGDIPLVWERSRLGGAREVTLWVDPGSSTLCQSPDWPILFWNLLRWRSAFLAGFAEPQLRLGGTARFRMPRQVRDVRVDGPHGMRLERRLQPAGPLLFEPRRPGLYHARAGATADWLACNLMAPAETDLSACASGTWGQWDTRQSRQRELASSTWLFGLLALGLLTLHGAWQHRQSRHR